METLNLTQIYNLHFRIAWTKEATTFLIESFQQEKYMWDPRSNGYKNRRAKRQKIEHIAVSLQENQGFIATPVQIVDKWNALKNYFSTCDRQKNNATKSGAPTEDMDDLEISPTWEFYEKLSFLKEKLVPTGSVNTFNARDIQVNFH